MQYSVNTKKNREKTMKRLTLGVALSAFATAGFAADMGAVDAPIKLAINEWTG